MKGLQYMFPGASKLWVIIMISVFGAMSCQQGCRCRGCAGCGGCTTSVVVEHEDEKMRVDGVDIKVRANKNRVTNRKLIFSREDIHVDKDQWYSVDYFLRVEKRDAIKNICEYDVPKNQDLDESLEKFSIKFSPDKNHFAVGLDNQVFDFFHLLPQGVPFSSGCYYLNDPNYVYLYTANIDFEDINWSRFPKPDALFDEIILPNDYAVWSFVHNRDNVLKLLDEMPPGNKHEMVLIENWYNDIADAHFTERRVKQIIATSPEWQQKASKNLIKSIVENNSYQTIELKATLDMVLWIDNRNTLNSVDSLIFIKYLADGYAGDYFVSRFENTKKPLNQQIKSELFNIAKSVCSIKSDRAFNREAGMSLTCAVDILLISKDYETLELFIRNNITLAEIEESFGNVPDATIDRFEKYPPDLQKLMVEKYTELMKVPDSDIFGLTVSAIVKFLADKASCSDLKVIVSIHEKNLMGFRMPKRCR
jgi:hypothetical protein